MMPCKGQSKPLLFRIKYLLSQELNVESQRCASAAEFLHDAALCISLESLSFETICFQFIMAYRIIFEVLVEHKSSVVTATKALRHRAGVYVIEF